MQLQVPGQRAKALERPRGGSQSKLTSLRCSKGEPKHLKTMKKAAKKAMQSATGYSNRPSHHRARLLHACPCFLQRLPELVSLWIFRPRSRPTASWHAPGP